MTASGLVFKDLLPIPDDTQIVSEPGRIDIASPTNEGATASHALANADHDEKGIAQLQHNDHVRDLGWNEPKQLIPSPLVGGMDNEELWKLTRRFNKVSYKSWMFGKTMLISNDAVANVSCQRIPISRTWKSRS